MSDKKQSSVDVLFEILWETPKDKWEWNAVLKKVKELHKEEIRIAYMDGAFEKIRHLDGKEFMMPTDYYNETFRGNNE